MKPFVLQTGQTVGFLCALNTAGAMGHGACDAAHGCQLLRVRGTSKHLPGACEGTGSWPPAGRTWRLRIAPHRTRPSTTAVQVLYSKFGFMYTEIKMNDEDYILIREDDVIGVMPRSSRWSCQGPRRIIHHPLPSPIRIR